MVYLSKNKVIPSTDSDSLKGFSFNKDRTKVIWESEVQQIIIRDKKGKVNKLATEKVNFPDDTVLHYHHLPYFLSSNTTSVKSIKCWLDNLKTKPQIAKNSPKVSILFSIEAYEKVIQRLMPNYKKNVMNFSEFYKQHDDKTDLLKAMYKYSNKMTIMILMSFLFISGLIETTCPFFLLRINERAKGTIDPHDGFVHLTTRVQIQATTFSLLGPIG